MVSHNYLGRSMVTNTSVNVLVSISSSCVASVKIMLQLIHFLLVVKFLLNLLPQLPPCSRVSSLRPLAF